MNGKCECSAKWTGLFCQMRTCYNGIPTGGMVRKHCIKESTLNRNNEPRDPVCDRNALESDSPQCLFYTHVGPLRPAYGKIFVPKDLYKFKEHDTSNKGIRDLILSTWTAKHSKCAVMPHSLRSYQGGGGQDCCYTCRKVRFLISCITKTSKSILASESKCVFRNQKEGGGCGKGYFKLHVHGSRWNERANLLNADIMTALLDHVYKRCEMKHY